MGSIEESPLTAAVHIFCFLTLKSFKKYQDFWVSKQGESVVFSLASLFFQNKI